MKLLRCLVMAAALGAAAASSVTLAFAQTPLDPLDDHSAKRLDRMEQVLKEMRAIVFQGRETGKPVVVEPADTDAQIANLSTKIDNLQQAITRLTGQLENAGHDLDQSRREADTLREENGALTARIAALEQKVAQLAAPPPAPAATPSVQLANPPIDAPAAFAAARAAFNAGDFAAAETGFKDAAQRFGDTPRGLESRYFLAKIALQRQAFADAASDDLDIVRQWPATTWAPDAALDLARAFLGMKEAGEACGVLAQIPQHYPKAGAAVRTGIDQLKGEAGCQAS